MQKCGETLSGKTWGAMASHSLLVIDDHKLRREKFSNTADILKKIRKLEKDHEAFISKDQRLYEDWFNLMFRQEQQEIESLERRYHSLSTFLIHLEYLSFTSQVSMEQAYLLLKDEERQYREGDEDWKFVIESLRQQRLEHAQKARASTSRTLFDVSEGSSVESPTGGPSKVDLSRLNRKDRTIYYYLKEISDVSLRRHLGDSNTGYELFREAFHVVMKCEDWQLLTRIWQAVPATFQRRLLKTMPLHLADFLNQLIAESQGTEQDTQKSEENELQVKSVYRKLARMLHPDSILHFSEDFKKWAQKSWQDVQRAYQKKDLARLKRLEFFTVVQLDQLNSLTMDEIQESSQIFAEELEYLQKSLKAYRKHPAWRFSSRKGYESLALKVRRDFKARMSPLQAEVVNLQAMLRGLETAGSPIPEPWNIAE